MTGGWAGYTWPAAIALASGMGVFLMDFAAERYVENKYGWAHGGGHDEGVHRVTLAGGELADAAVLPLQSNGCPPPRAISGGVTSS